MATMQNKRKRDAQDMAGGRAVPSMNQTLNAFKQHYLQTEDDGTDNTDGVMDFAAAFGQHDTDPTDAGEQNEVQGDGGGGQSASDTAAAAMAQYHTMTVPQSTEQSFMTQTTPEGGDRQVGSGDQSNTGQRTSSFGDFDVTATQSSPNGDASPNTVGATISDLNAPKPQVGTEEWHKVRRDNHKEGESPCRI